MQRYESYRPSGLDWLGDIPSHWGLKKSKFLWREKEDRSLLGEEELLSVSQYSGVVPRAEDSRSESLEDYKRCEPNDLVINIMLAWMSGLGVSKYSGIVSPAYCVYRQLEDHNPAYFDYLYRTPLYLAEFARRSKGIVPSRWRMYTEDFGQVLSLLPPREEQNRIVVFLDQKTAEIDAAIAKKERLIELIKEQKRTCIEKAITEGLEVPKNSEAGLSPKHWSRIKLKYCINLLPGFAFKSSSYSSNDSDIPLLRGVNVNPGKLNWEDKVSWPKASLAPHLKYLLEPGDLVIGMDRPWVADGIRVAPVQACDLPCLLLQRVARLRAANRITQEFLALVLTSRGFLAYFEPMLTGISVPHISPEQIGNYEATLPPFEEQEAICKFVSQLSRSCDQAIAKETHIVNGLRQLRASVIADVVLGKRKI